MKLANLIIAGAPKSGTTSLHHYLSGHPDVFACTPKEPMYFCKFSGDFTGPDSAGINRMVRRSIEEYEALFEDGQSCRYRVDGSTDYLHWPGAAESIFDELGLVKVVILLRNPVDRVFSEHMHLVRDGMEDLSLREAMNAEDERYQKRWNSLFYHRRRSLYADDIQKYIDVFGRDKLFVRTYDDLSQSPGQLLLELFEFLELEPIKIDTGAQYNRSGKIRFKILDDLSRGRLIPDSVKSVIRRVFGAQLMNSIRMRLRNVNISKSEKLSDADRAFLWDLFAEDVKRLEKILDRDLSAWNPQF